MTDRELLELAAKAAGYTLRFRDCDDGLPSIVEKEDGLWMPQDDDGDALRLAVRLDMTIEFDGDKVKVVCQGMESMHISYYGPAAAARFGITKAAAEIGRGM